MRLCFAICMLSLAGVVLGEEGKPKRVVCYYEAWASDRLGVGKYSASDLDPTLCTHVIFGYAQITACAGIKFINNNEEIDKVAALKKLSPETKFLVSIEAGGSNSPKYSSAIETPEKRQDLLQSVVGFLDVYGFDGLDIDWPYMEPTEKENFVDLLKELRTVFDRKGYVLSTSLLASEGTASVAYDIPAIAKYVDFIDLMAYEFHGPWEGIASHNAPIYSSTRYLEPYQQSLNVNASVKFWMGQDIPAEKLNLGIAFYAKTFTLADSSRNGPGSPTLGLGEPGQHTLTHGSLAYFEVCEKLANKELTSAWDDEQIVPYAYGGDQWVSFDNAWSIPWKTDFVKRNGLGGVMVRNIDMDDFLGACGTKNALLKAVNREVRPELGVKWE